MLHAGEHTIHSQAQQNKSWGWHLRLILEALKLNTPPHALLSSEMDQTVMVEELLLIMFKSQQVSPNQEDGLFHTYS